MSDEIHDDKMYHLICKERFDKIDSKQDEVLGLLRGKNGDPGLLDDVRTLKNRWKVIYGTAGAVALIVLRTVIVWVKDII